MKKKLDEISALRGGEAGDPAAAPESARILDNPAVRSLLRRDGLFGFGEAYRRGEIVVTDLEQVLFDFIPQTDLLPPKFSPRIIGHLLKELLSNPQLGLGAFTVARRHYDLGNDLFSAMLDSSMSYTCGYWHGAETLAEAQQAKLETLCKKLCLKPGMRVLDIGCGWGNFAHHAASRHGVSVIGLTVSVEQAKVARDRCDGLPVEILIQDYRDYSGSFDRVVSIEMIEAVGKKNLPGFFEMIHRCLDAEGLFALQVISGDSFNRVSRPVMDQYILWLLKHIFPNGYLPNLRELTRPARRGFVIEDLENLSTDYVRTLRAWHTRIEANWSTLPERYDAEFQRIWRFYLLGCAAFFRRRLVQVYQIVYSKGGVSGGYRYLGGLQ